MPCWLDCKCEDCVYSKTCEYNKSIKPETSEIVNKIEKELFCNDQKNEKFD